MSQASVLTRPTAVGNTPSTFLCNRRTGAFVAAPLRLAGEHDPANSPRLAAALAEARRPPARSSSSCASSPRSSSSTLWPLGPDGARIRRLAVSPLVVRVHSYLRGDAAQGGCRPRG